MKNRFNKRLKRLKIVAVYMAFNMLFNLAFPTVSMALTSGPAAPEFSSFEPVATTNMVDPFTGNFTYNLPVLSVPGSDGGGYAMSLSYHGGANSEEEASWVGLGWTLNVGAINRQKNGLVDEFKGIEVHRYNQVTPVWNASTSLSLTTLLSKSDGGGDADGGEGGGDGSGDDGLVGAMKGMLKNGISPSLTSNVRYNNYQGFSRSNSYGLSGGGASLNMTRSGGRTTFGLSVNPLGIMRGIINSRSNKLKSNSDKSTNGLSAKERREARRKEISEMIKFKKGNGKRGEVKNDVTGQSSAAFSSNTTFPAFSVSRTTGRSHNFAFSVKTMLMKAIVTVGYNGNFSYQATMPEDVALGYGYMHSPNWSDYMNLGGDDDGYLKHVFDDGESGKRDQDSRIISDYSVERQSAFNKQDNYLGIPFNTADQFVATGEGVMGGFRLHQEHIGTYFPTPTTNKTLVDPKIVTGVNLGIGNPIEIGVPLGVGFQRTQIGNWRENRRENIDYDFTNRTFAKYNNDMGGSLRYTDSDDLLATHFRKINKKLQVEPDEDRGLPGLSVNPSLSINTGRSAGLYYSYYYDSEVVSYDPSAIEIDEIFENHGELDKSESTDNLRVVRPNNGIAEIQSISPNGESYVYGLPVYAKDEKNLTVGHARTEEYDVDSDYVQRYRKDNAISGDGVEANIEMELNVENPKENYSVSGTSIDEPYATTYLLTQITTPNYVDVNNDGPDAADFGGWTKMQYRKKYGQTNVDGGGVSDNWYNHRAPYTGLFYDKGEINNSYDQTGSVSLGKKEVYYLKAIETKTHVAFFITNSTTVEDFDELGDQLFQDDEEGKGAFLLQLNGSGDIRYDGMDAANMDPSTGLDPAATGEMGDRSLDKLERIVLFSKTRLEKPLTTTHFQYSYELCKGVPNNLYYQDGSEIGEDYSKSGKLTLKKVWTESEGLVKTRIAPYQFEYNYFNEYEGAINAKYPNITDGFTDLNEDPNYDVDLLDPWGNYVDKETSKSQRDKLRPWMNQRENPEDFDPAAWNLKRVILPSGGEIHIQYEQKDYEYVQDKRAMTMVSLDPDGDHKNGMKYKDNRYYINLDDVQIDPGDVPAQEAYFDQLVNYFFKGSDTRMADAKLNNHVTIVNSDFSAADKGIEPSAKNGQLFFQFLYSYWDYAASIYDTGEDKFISDIIDGYAVVNTVGYDGSRIYLCLGMKKNKKINGEKDENDVVPRTICREKLLTQGAEGLDRGDEIELNFNKINEKIHDATYFNEDPDKLMADDGDKSGERKVMRSIVSEMRQASIRQKLFFRGLIGFKVKNPKKRSKKVCSEFDPELSYFKLPMYRPKKGGGIRVKRLLTYNPGIEDGEESLYGTEYIYKLSNGRSSGVATYEPNDMRLENPVVDILDNHKQTLYSRIVSGKDRKYQEGPLGEQLYPSPSVAHSHVVIRNIHTGKSAPGFVVNDYYTCKDYPSVMVDQTSIHSEKDLDMIVDDIIDLQSAHYKKSKINLSLGFFNYSKDNAWITQGYLFKINDMHGKMRRTATYGGNVDPDIPTIDKADNPNFSYTQYEYSHMDDYHKGISMVDRHFVLNPEYRPGEEEDITMSMGRVEDRSLQFGLDINIDIFYYPFYPSFGFDIRGISMSEAQLSQHVTNRVIRRNSMLKKVSNYVDGIKTTTEYLAYDENTGNPVLTKTTDQYAGTNSRFKNNADLTDPGEGEQSYYSFNVPASWVYPELGQKAKDYENLNILSANAGSVVTYRYNPLQNFTDVDDNPETNDIWDPYAVQLENVIEASAVELRRDRFDSNIASLDENDIYNMSEILEEYGIVGDDADDIRAKLNKFYYPVASYLYTDETKSANEGDNSYQGGVLDDFKFFKWHVYGYDAPFEENVLNKWKYVSEVSRFSPFGQPLEEINILGIPSAAKFGYGKLLPTIIAANAEYETIAFEDFEYDSDYPTTDNTAHTGLKSMFIPEHTSPFLLENILLTSRLMEKGGYFKMWLKSQVPDLDENEAIPKIAISGNEYNLAKVARVGEWSLYQVYIDDWGTLTTGDNVNISLLYNTMPGELVYVDDVCFNPKEASVNCNVYDPTTFRLMAQFGDQHFASIYEYNTEGQLIRTVIETERGRKTVQEQSHNTPRKKR